MRRRARHHRAPRTALGPPVFDEIASVGLPGAQATGELAKRFGDGRARRGGEDRHGIAGRVGGDEIALFVEPPRADAEDLAASIARHVGAGFAQLGGVEVKSGVADSGGDAASLLAEAAA